MAEDITLPKHSKSLSESQKIFLQPIDQHYDSEGVGQYDYSLIEDDLANLMTKVSRHSESETEELEVNLELDNSDELHFTKIALIADWEGKVKDLRQTNYENALALRDHAYYNPFLMTNKKFCDSYVYILKNYNSRTLNNITTKHTGY